MTPANGGGAISAGMVSARNPEIHATLSLMKNERGTGTRSNRRANSTARASARPRCGDQGEGVGATALARAGHTSLPLIARLVDEGRLTTLSVQRGSAGGRVYRRFDLATALAELERYRAEGSERRRPDVSLLGLAWCGNAGVRIVRRLVEEGKITPTVEVRRGGRVYRRFDPKTALAALERHRPDLLVGVPAIELAHLGRTTTALITKLVNEGVIVPLSARRRRAYGNRRRNVFRRFDPITALLAIERYRQAKREGVSLTRLLRMGRSSLPTVRRLVEAGLVEPIGKVRIGPTSGRVYRRVSALVGLAALELHREAERERRAEERRQWADERIRLTPGLSRFQGLVVTRCAG